MSSEVILRYWIKRVNLLIPLLEVSGPFFCSLAAHILTQIPKVLLVRQVYFI